MKPILFLVPLSLMAVSCSKPKTCDYQLSINASRASIDYMTAMNASSEEREALRQKANQLITAYNNSDPSCRTTDPETGKPRTMDAVPELLSSEKKQELAETIKNSMKVIQQIHADSLVTNINFSSSLEKIREILTIEGLDLKLEDEASATETHSYFQQDSLKSQDSLKETELKQIKDVLKKIAVSVEISEQLKAKRVKQIEILNPYKDVASRTITLEALPQEQEQEKTPSVPENLKLVISLESTPEEVLSALK